MPIYDISVPIRAQTPTFPGDPTIRIDGFKELSKGDAANVTALEFGAHTATHVDAPAHFIEGAAKLDSMPLEALIGPAMVVGIPDDAPAVTEAMVSDLDLSEANRVLFKTRNSGFWTRFEDGFREDFTYIEPAAARTLVRKGVRLVGIDYLSVEQFQSGSYATHLAFLEHGVVILEGLDLRDIEPGKYELICLPLRLEGGPGDGAPARAVLRTFD